MKLNTCKSNNCHHKAKNLLYTRSFTEICLREIRREKCLKEKMLAETIDKLFGCNAGDSRDMTLAYGCN